MSKRKTSATATSDVMTPIQEEIDTCLSLAKRQLASIDTAQAETSETLTSMDCAQTDIESQARSNASEIYQGLSMGAPIDPRIGMHQMYFMQQQMMQQQTRH